MTDPISAVGSILAVVGCAAETSKLLFKFFRRVPTLPRDIRHSSEALESLQDTLSQLQRCGAQLDPTYRFSAQFTRRLHECSHQLTDWAIKIESLDVKVAKTGSTIRVTRSWEKIKWLLYGEQEMRKFLDHMRLHQSAFSLELLAILLYNLPSVCLFDELTVLKAGAEQSTDALHLHHLLSIPARNLIPPMLQLINQLQDELSRRINLP